MLEPSPPKHQKQGPSPPNLGSAPGAVMLLHFLVPQDHSSRSHQFLLNFNGPRLCYCCYTIEIKPCDAQSGKHSLPPRLLTQTGGCCDISIRLPSPRLQLVARPNPSGILPPSRSPAKKKRGERQVSSSSAPDESPSHSHTRLRFSSHLQTRVPLPFCLCRRRTRPSSFQGQLFARAQVYLPLAPTFSTAQRCCTLRSPPIEYTTASRHRFWPSSDHNTRLSSPASRPRIDL